MKYYAVYKGKNVGIFNTWDECQESITGYSGAIFKKFNTEEEAQKYLQCDHNLIDSYFTRNKKEEVSTEVSSIVDFYDKKINTDKPLLNLYTDGSCINWNENKYAGYGIYIPEMNIQISKRLDEEHKTNNRAELTAILEAIKKTQEYMDDYHICIHTDSQYSMNSLSIMNNNSIENNFQRNGEDIPNRDIIEEGIEIMKENVKNVSLLKVKAHTGLDDEHSKGNEEADRLANEGSMKDIYNYCKENDKNLYDMPIPFGKYKDKTIHWIYKNNQKYLIWLLHNEELEGKYGYFYKCLRKSYDIK
jgi:ribonuclease HI